MIRAVSNLILYAVNGGTTPYVANRSFRWGSARRRSGSSVWLAGSANQFADQLVMSLLFWALIGLVLSDTNKVQVRWTKKGGDTNNLVTWTLGEVLCRGRG